MKIDTITLDSVLDSIDMDLRSQGYAIDYNRLVMSTQNNIYGYYDNKKYVITSYSPLLSVLDDSETSKMFMLVTNCYQEDIGDFVRTTVLIYTYPITQQ